MFFFDQKNNGLIINIENTMMMILKTTYLHFKCLIFMIPALLTSCQSTDKKASIINSKYFFLDAEEQMASEDPMVEFEKKHLLYGAISQKEKNQRSGHYYVFDWIDPNWSHFKNSSTLVRFEYRQKKTGSKIHRKDFYPQSQITYRNKTKIKITGKDYQVNGKVTAWRFSIIREGTIITSDQSYLW